MLPDTDLQQTLHIPDIVARSGTTGHDPRSLILLHTDTANTSYTRHTGLVWYHWACSMGPMLSHTDLQQTHHMSNILVRSGTTSMLQ